MQKPSTFITWTPIVHTSSKISSEHGCTSWFAPVSYHPSNKNAVIAIDLARDLTPLFDLTSEQIKTRLYTSYKDLGPDEKPIPVKLIHINKCPVVAPAKTLLPENAERLAIPREFCLGNLKKLKEFPEIREKLSEVFIESNEFEPETEAEQALYSGKFFSESDKAQMEILHQLPAEQLGSHPFQFEDSRLAPMLFNYRARNFPHLLDSDEQAKWQQYCQNKLQNGGRGILRR